MQNDNAKPISISKQLVYDAFLRVKANRGSAGIDKVLKIMKRICEVIFINYGTV